MILAQSAHQSFSSLEWRVITLGLSPSEKGEILVTPEDGLWSRLLKRFLGDKPQRPLADPRLEALRAMSAAIREQPDSPNKIVKAAFIAAGWDEALIPFLQHIAMEYQNRDVR